MVNPLQQPLQNRSVLEGIATVLGRDRNLEDTKMPESIERQDYSNYRVTYVDDVSPNQQFHSLQEQPQKSKLKEKLRIKRNKEGVYVLRNRHEAFHQLCREDDIVLDIDGDDWLIGSQVLKVSTLSIKKTPHSGRLLQQHLLGGGPAQASF